MNRAIVLDTETTGVEAPDVIQLAWLPLVAEFQGEPGTLIDVGVPAGILNFKPRKPISLGAMAAHHIIEEDLASFDPWPGTWSPPEGVEYLVGHNIDYDWQAIGSPPVRRICTLAIARKLWPLIDSHSLSAMTYYLMQPQSLAREAVKGAHSAGADAWLTHHLLMCELKAMPKIASWERLWEASERARMPTHFTFGKYGPADGNPGRLIAEIRREDPGYIEWCLYKCDQCKDEYWQRALKGLA